MGDASVLIIHREDIWIVRCDMVSSVDTVLGLLLGISVFLFLLSSIAYRRSGVRRMLLLSEGLIVHISFSVIVIASSYATDWLENVESTALVVADIAVLAAVLFLGLIGGRTDVGST